MSTLRVEFKATFCGGWPSLRFSIDNDVLEEFYFEQEHAIVEIPLSLMDGDHVLEIERFGKTNDNLVFENNTILQDQTVELLDIYVDNVRLPVKFKYQGCFYYNDQEAPGGLLWGPNGTYRWSFKTPIVHWLVFDKLEAEDYNMDLFIPGKYKFDQLINDLNSFEKSLNEK